MEAGKVGRAEEALLISEFVICKGSAEKLVAYLTWNDKAKPRGRTVLTG